MRVLTFHSFVGVLTMSSIAAQVVRYLIVYPLVLPVVLLYESSKGAWSLVFRHINENCETLFWFTLLFLPIFGLVSGVETAAYIGWTLNYNWSVWIGSFFVVELAWFGLLLPGLAIVLSPLLRFLDSIIGRVVKNTITFDGSIWEYSAYIADKMPFNGDFWKKPDEGWNSFETQNTRYATWTVLVSLIFQLVSIGAIASQFWHTGWANSVRMASKLLPWASIFGATFARIMLLVAYFSPAWIWSILSVLKGRAIPNIFARPVFLLVVDLIMFTPLGNLPIPQMIGYSILIFLLTLSYVVPFVCFMSKRTFLKTLVIRLYRQFKRFTDAWHDAIRWSFRTASTPKFLQSSNMIITPINFILTYSFCVRAGLHEYVAIFHATCVAIFSFLILETFFLGITLSLLVSYFISGFGSYYIHKMIVHLLQLSSLTSWMILSEETLSLPLVQIAIHIVWFGLSIHPGVTMLSPLGVIVCMVISYVIPDFLLNILDRIRRELNELIKKMILKWERAFDVAMSDRSLFGPMFGWILTSVIVGLAVVQFGAMYFTSSTSPIYLLKNSLPSFNLMYLFEHAGNNLNTTQSILNSTLSNATDFATNATSATTYGPTKMYYLGHIFVDYVVFMAVLGNSLILLGKLASMVAPVAFVLVIGFATFMSVRQSMHLYSFYAIVSEALALEVAVVTAFATGGPVFVLLLYIFSPITPSIGPWVVLPFEKLWALQQWLLRSLRRVYYRLLDLVRIVWISVLEIQRWAFGYTPPVPTATLRRPRR